MSSTGRYAASKEQLLGRLARVEGQVRGVGRMVEEDRDCIDVLVQIAASRAALDGVALGLLDGHVHHCILVDGEGLEDRHEQVEALMRAVGRLVTS